MNLKAIRWWQLLLFTDLDGQEHIKHIYTDNCKTKEASDVVLGLKGSRAKSMRVDEILTKDEADTRNKFS